MDARIRREALKAAAKVAVSLVAVSGIACGAKIDGGSKDDALIAGNDDTGTSTPRPPASGANEEGNVVSPSQPAKADASHADATPEVDASVVVALDANVDLAACDAKLTALKVDSGGAWPPTPFAKTPENVACCTAILDEIEKSWQFSTENQWACCATTAPDPEQPFHRMACTPWGPPMPPEMPAFLAAVA